jgi:hypothetical protein
MWLFGESCSVTVFYVGEVLAKAQKARRYIARAIGWVNNVYVVILDTHL